MHMTGEAGAGDGLAVAATDHDGALPGCRGRGLCHLLHLLPGPVLDLASLLPLHRPQLPGRPHLLHQG